MAMNEKKGGRYEKTVSWRPKSPEIKEKWKELGASRWLNRIIAEMLGKKDEIPTKQP